MCSGEVVRQPGELVRCDADGADVVADHPREVLLELGEPFGDGAHPPARLAVAIDAGSPEVAQHPLVQPQRRRVLSVRNAGVEDVVEHWVEIALGALPVDVSAQPLGERAHVRVRVDLAQQVADRSRVAQGDVGVVPQLEDVRGAARGAVLERVEHVAAAL